MNQISDVSLEKCPSYDEVKSKLIDCLSRLGGLNKFIRPNQKVLLKPNLCNPPQNGNPSTTSPEFMRAIIELVKEITPNVYVSDLPAIEEEDITRRTLIDSGIMSVLSETNTKWVDPAKCGFIAKDINNYSVLERTDFSSVYFHADVVINLPKLKSHGITYITGAVKNLFGLVHMDERKYLHSKFSGDKFSDGIVDIYSFLKSKTLLHIMDAVVAMEGNEGPSYGPSVNVGYIIASTDGVSVDAVASELTGHASLSIPPTKIANKRGIGVGELNRINLFGVQFEKTDFCKHSNYEINRSSNLQTKFPFISSSCKKCLSCKSSCPVDAISIVEDRLVVDTHRCIKCYCCVENCVFNAIELK